MALYPLPSILAFGGWIWVYKSSGAQSMILSVVWIALGIAAFMVWARVEKTWPFGPKEIREEYLTAQRSADDDAAAQSALAKSAQVSSASSPNTNTSAAAKSIAGSLQM